MTQGVDGGEAGSAACGIDARNEADADGDDERADDGPPDELDGLVEEAGQDRRPERRHAEADQPAGEAEHGSLGQELRPDRAGPRAERLAQTDLADPL